MKQELLLKTRFPHTEAAIVKTVRIVVAAMVAIYWFNELFIPRPRRRP